MKTKQTQLNMANREYLTDVSYKSLGPAQSVKKIKKTKPLECKYCQSQSYEILIGKSYGKTKAWQERSHVRNIFKFHCYKCGAIYYFKPDKPSLAEKAAKNKVPFYSDSFKKKFITPQMKKLKLLRNKKARNENYKLEIKYYEQYLAKHLGINQPMEVGSWLIVKDKNNQVQIFDDKNKYYRKEARYQHLLEKRYEDEQTKITKEEEKKHFLLKKHFGMYQDL